jgi:hypothetical protein
MSDELLTLLIQIPLVAAFMWYSERMSRQFQDYLREERLERNKSLDKFAEELRTISSVLREHDEKTDLAVAMMRERTGATNAPKRKAAIPRQN